MRTRSSVLRKYVLRMIEAAEAPFVVKEVMVRTRDFEMTFLTTITSTPLHKHPVCKKKRRACARAKLFALGRTGAQSHRLAVCR